jgi:hypothetical protein
MKTLKTMESTVVSKGDLMKLVYNKEELRSIDSAIPTNMWDEYPPIKHVMNYNENRIFGKIENLFEVAEARGIEVPEHFNRIKNQ